ncbi:MAG: MmgE/PrpD family protein [Arenibacterium sp.]
MTPIDFIPALAWSDLPANVRRQAQLCLLDLLGVAAGGLQTDLSRIIRDHAVAMFGGTTPLLFDHRSASAAGAALAAGMTTDSLDGHDGYNPAKGHIGAPLIPAMLAMTHGRDISGAEFLTTLVLGYEFGARAAVAQHATVPDYHTSGSWGAVTAAAAGARLTGLDRDMCRHALGIAEYHGPRSQMMRCIDHPTMLKDGAGWGAMTGVSAVDLAARGFTGAPAITVEDAPDHWNGLGTDWLIMEQYFKPYPVCRWAQSPIEGILTLARRHQLSSDMVEHIEVTTFHESVRLATSRPRNTEEAQYSTSFPCAVALVKGGVAPEDITGDTLHDPEILRLSTSLVMKESDHANENFPSQRLSKVALHLKDGRQLEGEYMNPLWAPDAPATEAELVSKFRALTEPVLGIARSRAIEAAIDALPETDFHALETLLYQPISAETISGKSA